jgi:hypothetical protein
VNKISLMRIRDSTELNRYSSTSLLHAEKKALN